jgi:hypothetical protein
VTITGVPVGDGAADGVGVALGPGDALGVGAGVAEAGEYWIASHEPSPSSVYVLPEATPVVSMLVKIPAVTTGAVHDVFPTPVGEGEGDGVPPGLADGVGEAVPGADVPLGSVFPVPPEPLHCASATLSAHTTAKPRVGAFVRMGTSVRSALTRQGARRVYAAASDST